MYKKDKRKKTKPARPRLDSVFASGRDTVFASGSRFDSGNRREKEEPPVPVPWPGEETIMLTEEEKSRSGAMSRARRRSALREKLVK